MNQKSEKAIAMLILVTIFAAVISCGMTLSAKPASGQAPGTAQGDTCGQTRPGLSARRELAASKMPRSMQHASFFDDSTVSYISGNSLYLSSLRVGGPEVEFHGHSDHIHDYKAGPDRKRIVTSSADGTLRLWDSRTGECLAVSEPLDTLGQPRWTMLHEIVYHPDGSKLMTSDMNGLKIWSASDLTLLSEENSDYFYMTTGLISPDWKTVCAPVPESYIDCAVCERSTGDLLLYLDNRYPLSYSPDGSRILAANLESGAMEIYDVNPGTPRGRFSGVWVSSSRIPLKAAAFSPDGCILASAQEGGLIRLWDTMDGTGVAELDWEGHDIDGICFDAEGGRLLAYDTESGEYCLWYLRTKE